MVIRDNPPLNARSRGGSRRKKKKIMQIVGKTQVVASGCVGRAARAVSPSIMQRKAFLQQSEVVKNNAEER